MNRRHWLKFLLLTGAIVALGHGSVFAKHDKSDLFFLQPKDYAFDSILPDPPKLGSSQDQADLAQLKSIYDQASSEEKEAANEASTDSVFDFSQVLGASFNPMALPQTAALFAKVTTDLKDAVKVAKNHYQRPRPNLDGKAAEVDENGKPDYAYPSGHTTRAYAWALLLAELYPDKRQALLDEAAQKGHYRIVAGKHYPTDVQAGKIYGEFLARQFLDNSDFRHEWKAVKEEIGGKVTAEMK